MTDFIASSLTCNKCISSFTFVTACKRTPQRPRCDQPLLLVVVCEDISCSRRLHLPPSRVLVQHPQLVGQRCPRLGCTLLLCCSKTDPSCPSKTSTRGPATSTACISITSLCLLPHLMSRSLNLSLTSVNVPKAGEACGIYTGCSHPFPEDFSGLVQVGCTRAELWSVVQGDYQSDAQGGW